MSRRSLDISLAGAGPQRLSVPHAAVALAIVDFASVVLAGLACRGLNPPGHAAHTPHEVLVVVATGTLAVALLHRRGLSGQGPRPARGMEAVLCIAHAFAILLLVLLFCEQAMTFRLGPSDAMPADGILATNRNWLFTWAIAALLTLLLARRPVEAALAQAAPAPAFRRAVVVGNAASARRLARVLAEPDRSGTRVEIAGALILTPRGLAPLESPTGWPRLDTLRAARALIEAGEADLLLIVLPETASRSIAAILRIMAGVSLDIWLAPDIARLYEAPARLSSLVGVPFLHLQERPMAGFAAIAKRAEDLLLGLPLLLLVSPLMLAIALAVRLTSPGPVLFVQPRRGLNRRVIRVRKFRTMAVEAADGPGARQTVAGDARVTPLGRFLRRTSLDELPQLLNVVEGSMSLVGPRPHALGTAAAGRPFAEAAADYAGRHRVKPGMTGWAQVCGWRGETDTVEKLRRRVEHDLFYIAHWSLGFDLRILAMTLRTVIRGEGV